MSKKCLNCGKPVSYEEVYCQECVDYLASTDKLPYNLLWKYKLSDGGCIGCMHISTENGVCVNCTRDHVPAPPFKDYYDRSGY